MELREFISKTIEQIVEGVREGVEHGLKNGAFVNPNTRKEKWQEAWDNQLGVPIKEIEFDVAITTEVSSSQGGKGGVGISVIKVGAEATHNKTDSSVSRIKFSVPIAFPTKL